MTSGLFTFTHSQIFLLPLSPTYTSATSSCRQQIFFTGGSAPQICFRSEDRYAPLRLFVPLSVFSCLFSSCSSPISNPFFPPLTTKIHDLISGVEEVADISLMSTVIFDCFLIPGSRNGDCRSSLSRSITTRWRYQKLCCPITATASKEVKNLLDCIKWDEKGLVVAIAQNVDTGTVLMQGFANRKALEATLLTRKATFYSRSRSSLWTKGETSSNFINVLDIFLDCDRDSVIYLGKPDGPTCHTGSETCYYTSVFDILEDSQKNKERLALTTLYSLETMISERKQEIETEQNRKPSWTRKLMHDNELLCSKIREEAEELARTLIDDEDGSRSASEMGDLLYHAMVLLKLKDVRMEDVFEVLRKRFSQSGIEEKNSRT